MSNKRDALILGLASFSFFFGAITFTSLADQEKNHTTAQQVNQDSAGQHLNLFASNSSSAGLLNILPRANENPVPFSENSTSKIEDNVEAIPLQPKSPLQPPVSTSPASLQDQSPTKLTPSEETKPQQDQSPAKLNPSEEIKPEPTPEPQNPTGPSPTEPTKPDPKPISKKKTTKTKAS